jgi:hypothetical protein
MAITFNSTDFDGAMKENYSVTNVRNLVLNEDPLLSLLEVDEGFDGDSMPIPVIISQPGNVSATDTVAFSGTSDGSVPRFVLTRSKLYNQVSIDGETLKAAGTTKGAFVTAKRFVDLGLKELGRHWAASLYRDGWGDIGQIGSISSTTVTLSDKRDHINFRKGMKVVFATTQAASTLRSATAVTINSVDRSNGVVVLSATTGSPAAGDYIFIEGCRQNSATPSRLMAAGLGAWLPTSVASSGDSFLGLDRYVDSNLYGCYLDASVTGMPIDEALIEGAAMVRGQGGSISHVFMNSMKFAELCKVLQGKVEYVPVEGKNGAVSFTGIVLNTPGGAVTVVDSPLCPYDRGFGLDIEQWSIKSLGAPGMLLNANGLTMHQDATYDRWYSRFGLYANLACHAPGWNVRIKF